MLLNRVSIKFLFCFGITWAMSVHADIYKWRDERGIVHYSDVPPSNTQAVDKLSGGKTDWPLTRSDAPKREEEGVKSAPITKSHESSAMDHKLQAVEAAKQMEARLKAQNCANARTNFRNYSIGGRIQNVNENGEKSYMSDDEIREGMARAQQEIEANCTQ